MPAQRIETPIARCSNITLIREGKPALKRVSFTVKPGEHWALLGPNGSGKSSLLSVLQGWLWPQQGSLEVLGHVFGEDDLSELRKHIGWVGGEIENEFPRWQSVADIAASGGVGTIGLQFDVASAEVKRMAMRNLTWVGLRAYAARPCKQLSQGQTRLLTIARALMTSPRLLVLDEPCTGLDPVARLRFLNRLSALLRVKGGPSAFYVTHHVEEIVPEVTHALLLRQGKVIAAGQLREALTAEHLSLTFGAKVKLTRSQGRYHLVSAGPGRSASPL
jgi:iron complex transport system ATP-binding protein